MHVFLALHQEQGIILKLFIFMSRVRLSSTQKFGLYPPGVFGFSSCASHHLSLCMELQTSDFECMYISICVCLLVNPRTTKGRSNGPPIGFSDLKFETFEQ